MSAKCSLRERLFGSSRSRRTSPVCKPPALRRMLETLEDRTAPAVVTVTTLSEAPAHTGTSLRDAISAANPGDTIQFQAGLSGAIDLSTAEGGQGGLALTKNVTIDGTGATITIEGGSSAGSSSNAEPFFVNSGVTAVLNDLTISNGYSTQGGGIYNGGTLTVSNSTLANNHTFVDGGAIDNRGTLTVSNSTLANNSTNYFGNGAGYGGGIYNQGTLTVSNSTLLNNSANNTGNRAVGGGIMNNLGTLAVNNSTFSGNSADIGGAITNAGMATVNDSTLAGNSGSPSGGGGITNTSTLNLANTIVANSVTGPDLYNSGTVATAQNDLIGSQTGSPIQDGISGNIVGKDPLLSALGDYGGLTQTMALLPGSPALDAGSSAAAAGLATDQRGQPRTTGGAVDIGAFESRGFTLSASGGSGQSALVNTAFASPLTVTVTSASGEPVAGGRVTFAAPASGASAGLAGSPATVGADGRASVTATANGVIGQNYSVTAGAAGAGAVGFTLSNSEAPSLAVTTLADVSDAYDGRTSLREAVAYANTLAGPSTVTFAPGLSGAIDLSTSEGGQGGLALTKNVTIDGTGATITIEGGNTYGNQTNVRPFVVNNGATAILNCLTISNGLGSWPGGGDILNDGTLSVTNCVVVGGGAGPGANGGGILNAGSLRVTNCTLGSALANNGAIYGGGLYNQGTATLTNSTVLDNGAVSGAGGIGNTGTLTLLNCTLTGNHANYDVGGGALYISAGSATLVNCTVAGNTAAAYGGGIGGGIDIAGGAVTLSNTIVAGNNNGSTAAADDIQGSVNTAQSFNNLIGTGGSGGLANNVNGNQVGVANPLLSALGNYGGPTQTMALLPGSPALDAGSSAAASGLSTDQRGQPRTTGGTADIGAFESRGFALSLSGAGQSTPIDAAFASPLAVTVSSPAGEPVAGGRVSFAAPASGASAALSASAATLDANGQASVTATANGSAGGYAVAVSVGGSWTASASLTNLKATPALTAAAGPTVVYGSGARLTESAALSGPPGMGGTVTFVLRDPSGAVVDTEAAAVSGPGTYGTPAGYLPGGAGIYQWSARYSGDANDYPVAPPLGATVTSTLTGLYDIYDVAIDAAGNRYVAQSLPNSVAVFAPGSNNPTRFLTGVSNPTNLSLDPAGDLFVGSAFSGGLWEFAAGSTTPTANPNGLTNAGELPTFDAHGDMFVRGYSGSNTVSEFAPGGTTPMATLTGLSGPADMAFDAAGDIFVQNAGNATVSEFTPGSTTPTANLTGLSGPGALACDAGGDLFVVNTGNATVSEFAPGSTTPTATLTGLNAPGFLAVDASGDVFVSNNNVTVSEFAAGHTTPTTTLTGLNRLISMALDGQGDLYAVDYGTATVSEFTPVTMPETVSKATPAITWPNPADITYGTALGAAQLNATANVPGTFSYSPGSGTALGIGRNQPLSVTFTPSDTADYTGATKSVTINVTEAPNLAVTALADVSDAYDGQTSLREAIAYADSLGGSRTITFAPAVFGTAQTIALNGTQLPTITDPSLTITGPGASLLTIDAQHNSRIFAVNSGAALSLSGLTLANGSAAGDNGGAIINSGSLALSNCTLYGNSAEYRGGCIYSTTSFGGTLTVSNSTLHDNSVGLYGGCIYSTIYSGGTLAVSNSTLYGNSTQNAGGAIYSSISLAGTLAVSNSTLYGNSAAYGGGIYNNIYSDGTMSVTNSTVSGNSASNSGGGILNYHYGSAKQDALVNALVAGNNSPFAPDVYDFQGGTITVASSLIGDGAYSGIGDGTNGNQVGDTPTHPAVINPLLSPLGYYGGPTQTMALLPGSPALDSGSNAAGGGLTTDQRGQPRVVNGTVDIGAFESHGFSVVLSSGGGQSTPINTAFANPLAVTVSSLDGTPVAGGALSFTAPASGASAALSAPSATLDASGRATVTATANGSAGSYTVTVSAGGSWSAAASLTNLKGTPTVTWPNPADITYGTALGAAQLNATASVPGSFVYSPAGGTLLSAGSGQSLTVTFTPADTADYTPATRSVLINVSKATLTVTADSQSRLYGDANPILTVSYSGFVNGEDAGVLGGSPSVTTAATASSGVGSYAITVAPGSLAAANYAYTFVNGTLAVTPAMLTVMANNVNRAYGAANPTLTAAITGFVNGDGPGVVQGAPGLTTAAAAASPVGGYSIVAALGTLNAANYTFAFVNGTLTVTPATPTVVVQDAGGLFTGQADTATATVAGTVTGVDDAPSASLEGITPTLAYYAGNTAGGTPLPGAPAAAGTYTAVATFAGSGDYTSATASTTFVIGRAAPTLAVSDAGGTYNGRPFPATATVAGVVPGVDTTPAASLEGVGLSLTYYAGSSAGGTALAGAPTAAGTYTAVASFAGSADYAPANTFTSFTIGLAPPTVSVSDTGGTFNGQPFPATGTVAGVVPGVDTTPAATLEGVAPTLAYYVGDSAAGPALPGAPSGAGTYTVVATFAGSADYAAASASLTFTVAAATPTVTVIDAGGTFNGQPFPATAAVAGVVPGVDTTPAASLEGVSPTLSYYAGSSDSGTELPGAPSASGTYTVVAVFPGSANYGAASASTTFVIASAGTKAKPTVAVTDAGGTYTGQPFPAAATVAGLDGQAGPSLEGVGLTLTYYAGGRARGTPLAAVPVAAGKYTVLAAFAGSADYNAASASTTFTIAKAPPTVAVTAAGGTYTGQPFPAAATVAGIDHTPGPSLEGVTPILTYYAVTGGTTKKLSGAPTAAGSYQVVAWFAGSTDYAAAADTATFAIAPTTPVVTVVDAGGVFTGKPFPAKATVTGVSGTPAGGLEGVSPTLTYYAGSGAGGAALPGAPAAAGTYTVVAAFASSADYAAATASTTFTIDRAAPKVVVSDRGGTFTGQPFPAAANVAGVVNGVDNTPADSLEGVGLTLTYYAVAADGTRTPLGGAPSGAGDYQVDAAFAGSDDYASSVRTATFTVKQAAPTLTITAPGGTYNGQPFAATVAVTGVSGTSAPDLEGVSPTLAYYLLNADGTKTLLTGVPAEAGRYEVDVSFAGSADYLAAARTATFTIKAATPVFGGLASPTVARGTAATVVSGTIALGGLIPTGTVIITLHGVSLSAVVQPDGSFSAAFDTGSLTAGTYAITFSYLGDNNFKPITGRGTLTVTP